MPRVIKRTPEWLVPPAPGHSLFSSTKTLKSSTEQAGSASSTSPLRTIAKGRGTEVFIAVGNELRWADLGVLKQGAQQKEEFGGNSGLRSSFRSAGEDESAYRVGPSYA
jgi:nucleoporin NUP82